MNIENNQFPVKEYVKRAHTEKCDVCGSGPGFWCRERRFVATIGREERIPVESHIIAASKSPLVESILDTLTDLTESDYTEIPVEHQALSSGRLMRGC